MAADIAIVVHGGAGTINREALTPELEAEYRSKLEASVSAGYSILKAGGASIDAVTAAITVLEDSPLFNAGVGSVLNNDGRVEMDASIMEGKSLNAGAVAGLQHVRNPILLAQAVLDKSPHVMLMGEGAEAFAREQGFDMVGNHEFRTKRRQEQLRRAQAAADSVSLSEEGADTFRGADASGADHEKSPLGTVGAVAIDASGTIVAGTSTGGMTNKRFGRIGDSPIIGAGTYAKNGVCGISATGHGEFFIRAAVAHDICARVSYQDTSLDAAADEVVNKVLREMGADGGVIGIDADANVVMQFNSSGMYRAAVDRHGKLSTAIFAD